MYENLLYSWGGHALQLEDFSSKHWYNFRQNSARALYIQLAETSFRENSDRFTVRVAETPEEIQGLLEVGLDYICEKDGLLYFKKRK